MKHCGMAILAATLAAGAAAPAQALPSYTRELAVQFVEVCSDAGATCRFPEHDPNLLQSMFDLAGIRLVFPEPLQLLDVSYVEVSPWLVDGVAALEDFADASPAPAAHTVYVGGAPDMTGGLVTAYRWLGAPAAQTPWSLVADPIGLVTLPHKTAAVAHAIGHNLGARHDGDGNTAPATGYLMSGGDYSLATQFSTVSLEVFADSPLPAPAGTFASPVPVPAAAALLATGLGALAWLGRRRLNSPAGSS